MITPLYPMFFWSFMVAISLATTYVTYRFPIVVVDGTVFYLLGSIWIVILTYN